MYESWTRKSSNSSVKLNNSKKCRIDRETGCGAHGTALGYRLWHAELTKFMKVWQTFFLKLNILRKLRYLTSKFSCTSQ